MAGKVFGKFQQFCLAKLAVFVGIKFHGMLHHSLRIRSHRRTIGSPWPSRSATLGTAPFRPFTTGTTSLRRTTLTARSPGRRTIWTAATFTAAAHRAELVLRQFSIFILVELCQRFGGFLQFVGRNDVIMVRI